MLEASYPNVIYREISVLFNIEVQKSISELAEHMQRYRQSYAQQRMDQIRSRTTAGTSRCFTIDIENVMKMPSNKGGANN